MQTASCKDPGSRTITGKALCLCVSVCVCVCMCGVPYTGWIGQVANDSSSRNVPLQDMNFNQYNSIELIRLAIDVDTTCEAPQLYW